MCPVTKPEAQHWVLKDTSEIEAQTKTSTLKLAFFLLLLALSLMTKLTGVKQGIQTFQTDPNVYILYTLLFSDGQAKTADHRRDGHASGLYGR